MFTEFDPDPVKKWKEIQKKKELEETGEVDMNEDEEDKEEEADQTDGEKAVDSKLSDYDYLVGMALIKLSEEEKNRLLKVVKFSFFFHINRINFTGK